MSETKETPERETLSPALHSAVEATLFAMVSLKPVVSALDNLALLAYAEGRQAGAQEERERLLVLAEQAVNDSAAPEWIRDGLKEPR